MGKGKSRQGLAQEGVPLRVLVGGAANLELPSDSDVGDLLEVLEFLQVNT